MIRPKTFLINNKVTIISFFITILSYSVYVVFRGFGWDGDSFISASQFQKLIGSDLYGLLDGATHPKILSIILFGIVYQFTGGFYILTCISILLNALMISVIANWINNEKGVWIIAIFGLLINIPWTKIVVNCDNPAFSMPFIIFGLYYISCNKYKTGALYLMISSLFRSGSEFIILIIIIIQIFDNNLKNVVVLLFAFVLSSIHSYWGYLIVYPSRDFFWEITWKYLTTSENIADYKHSLNAFIPYILSVLKQLFTKYSILFIIPFIIGLARLYRKTNSIKYILLTPISSIILPIGSFLYGTAHRIYETKHMGFTFILPIFAAFSINSSILSKISKKTKLLISTIMMSIVITFSIIAGIFKNGDYEAHVNGTGRIGWTKLSDVKQDVKLLYPLKKINILTAYNYLTFTILDVGKYANNIDVVKTESEIDYHNIYNYELIIIPKEWSIDSINISNLGYIKKSNDYYNYYISKNSNDR